MSRIENLQKGVTSLEFRISALALRLANAKSSTASTEDPIAVAKQIALYGRVLDILRDELDLVDEDTKEETEPAYEIKLNNVNTHSSFWR